MTGWVLILYLSSGTVMVPKSYPTEQECILDALRRTDTCAIPPCKPRFTCQFRPGKGRYDPHMIMTPPDPPYLIPSDTY
jgi:hypothetical protein